MLNMLVQNQSSINLKIVSNITYSPRDLRCTAQCNLLVMRPKYKAGTSCTSPYTTVPKIDLLHVYLGNLRTFLTNQIKTFVWKQQTLIKQNCFITYNLMYILAKYLGWFTINIQVLQMRVTLRYIPFACQLIDVTGTTAIISAGTHQTFSFGYSILGTLL